MPHMQDLVAQHAATIMSRIATAPNNSLERTGMLQRQQGTIKIRAPVTKVRERAPAAHLCLRPKHRQLAAVRRIKTCDRSDQL